MNKAQLREAGLLEPKKKRSWTLLVIPFMVVGLAQLFLLTSSKPADPKEVKPAYSKAQILSLESLGLTKSKEYRSIENYDNIVHADLVKKYKDKYDLQFISEQGLALFAAQNDLITAEPEKYIGHLDFDIAKAGEKKKLLIKDWEAYNKTMEDNVKNAYNGVFVEGGNGVIRFLNNPELGTTYIVAPKEMFQLQEGDRIVDGKIVPRDPLLIHSLPEGGYVILAKW